jgi:hypothetical protein
LQEHWASGHKYALAGLAILASGVKHDKEGMMMRRVMPVVLLLVLVTVGVVSADSDVPAINLPYGAKINTEVLLTDNDLLGVVKEGVPAFVQLIGKMGGPKGMSPEAVNAMRDDVRAAMAQVTAVRFLAAQYPMGLKVKTLADTLNTEAKKSGKFTRIISHVSEKDSVVAVYAAADKGGYLGYYYDVKSRSMMAGRVVGFLDVDKLMSAAVQAIDSLGSGLGSLFGQPTEPKTSEDGTAPSEDTGVTAPTTDDSTAPAAPDAGTTDAPTAATE